jgi:hypothetical protein
MGSLNEDFIGACGNGYFYIVNELLNKVDLSYNNFRAIENATSNAKVEVTLLLLEYVKEDENFIDAYKSALYGASFSKKYQRRRGNCIIPFGPDIAMIKILFNKYPNITQQEVYHGIFFGLAGLGEDEAVKLFLENKNIDPSYNNNYVLKEAVREIKYSTTELLLSDPRVSIPEYIFEIVTSRFRLNFVKLFLKNPRLERFNYKFIINESRYKEYPKLGKQIKKLIRQYMLKKIFHKLNEIICKNKIRLFLLKYVILCPKSKYIQRLIKSF